MIMQLFSMRITHFICVLSFILAPLYSNAQEIDPYHKNLRRLDEMLYILNSKWAEGEEQIWRKYIETVNTQGFDFQPNSSKFLRYTRDSILLEEGFDLRSYKTSTEKEWIYVIRHDDAESLSTQYQKYRDLWKKKREKGIGGMGENGNMSAYKIFGQFITYQTGEELSTINVYIRSRNYLLIMGIDLDFPIKGKREELSQEQAIKLRDEYDRLQILLDTFSDLFIDESEQVMKPLRGKRMTAAQRLYGFTQFWTEVKYNFAFFDQVPDLDWDQVLYEYLPIIQADQSNEEYFRTLKLICAKLGDGHTNIYPPREDLDWPGIQLKNFGQKAYVVNIKEEFASEIPLGTEVLSVDGIETASYLKEKVFPYISSSTDHIRYNWGIRDMLDGKKDTEVKLKLKLPNGKLTEQKFIRNKELGGKWLEEGKGWKLFELSITEENFAHIKLNSFGREQIVEEFEKRVDSIKACKGVIIDLRGNGGGSSGTGYAILNHFTNKAYKGSQWRTREHRASFKAWGQFVDESTPLEELSEWNQRARLTFKGEYWHIAEPSEYKSEVKDIIKLPLVVLIGNNTASAAEDFLVALDQLKIAKLIGSPTFGSTGQPLMMNLPGGGRARICTKRDTYPDGREFVGFGIQPDFKVEQTIDDYLEDKDVVLEYARKYLKENPNFAKGK